ncbi:MAG: 16S rRNA (cytosine(1402)-N(4))-methyltransferase RsmH [Muribaculum sp.]|nr:16S rRNA (cytosine(1402)-N(4))-methyltransferase RsmH [Muribaculum sp.]
MSQEIYHIPALLDASMEALNLHPDGTYVDATFGGGGHSRAILSHLGDHGRLLSFDQDIEARENAIDDPRFTFVHGNFRYLKNFLRYYDALPVDGILADLGVSFHHFDDPTRGFSFRFDSRLDMRMNRKATRSADELLNESTEEELKNIFHTYGQFAKAGRLASAIVRRRDTGNMHTVADLLDVARPFINPRQEKKELAMIFQALRIVVNDEMFALKSLLTQALSVLKPGGRLAIITYHSLEDRLVKNFFKTGNFEGIVKKDFFGNIIAPLTPVGKAIAPTEAEIESNPRSRSAKLRVAELNPTDNG